MTADENAAMAWRNLITQWHLDAGLPDCGCDDDTPDHKFCPPSVAWADVRLAEQQAPDLTGPTDRWNHDIWVAAWGRNLPVVASANDFRLPMAPPGTVWMAKRVLVGGQQAVELTLYRIGPHQLYELGHARIEAEPGRVAARARRMLQDLPA